MSMLSITTKAFAAGLVLMASLAPAQVFAWQKHRGSSVVIVNKDPALLNKGPIAPPSFVHPRPFVAGPFVRGTVIYSAPPVYYVPSYAPPAYYDPPPTYYVPPAYVPPATYYPPTAYAPPSGGTVAVAPTPNVINYPNGRYELRGDGATTPYTWVWIPNPPSSPPPPAATPAPAPPAAPPGPSSSDGAPAARQSTLFRWTDEAGVVHWTDRIDAVPEQYPGRAKQTQPS